MLDWANAGSDWCEGSPPHPPWVNYRGKKKQNQIREEIRVSKSVNMSAVATPVAALQKTTRRFQKQLLFVNSAADLVQNPKP